MELDFNELRQLITAISDTNIAEFTLKSGDFELVVRKDSHPGELVLGGTIPPTVTLTAAPPSVASAPSAPAPVPSPAPNPPAAPPLGADRLVEVVSPMVGTFYRAPAPDEPPFVDIADRIQAGQTVCIIEAMKLMNEIEAEVSGEVVEILALNGEPVEFGQVLMRVKPA